MQHVREKNNAFSVSLSSMLAASKTANIFTQTRKFLQSNKGKQKVTVSLDWLSFLAYCYLEEPKEKQEGDHRV